MSDSGRERPVDHASDGPQSPPRLLNLLIIRLAEPAAVLDDSLTVVAANDAFAALAGTDRALVGKPLTTVVPALSRDTVEGNIETADEYVAVQTGGTPERTTEFGFDRHGSYVLCIGRTSPPDRHRSDGADRQAQVETLANLQTAIRDLLAAETEASVAEHVVETATGVLGLSGATLYLFDASRNVLWPAGSAGTAGTDDRVAIDGDDGGVVREVFLAGAATTAEGGDRYQPLGEYGVLHTVAADELSLEHREGVDTSERRRSAQRDERQGELVDLLAEGARAALERVDREATLRERDASQREQAERVIELERMLSVVRRVHRVLVEAETVSDIEQGVCAALTASEWLSFAWLGGTAGDSIEPRAWAGRESDYLEAVSFSSDDPHAPPAVRTADSNQPTTVDAVAEAIREGHWRTAAIARDFQAAISVPLWANGVSYGTLTAYANQPVEWDDALTAVFAELGASVAVAVRDRERRNRLTADTGVELDLVVTAPGGPLGQLAATLGVTMCCTEAIPVDGTTTRLFVSVPEGDGDTVADAVEEVRHIDSVVALSGGDRYELLVHESGVLDQVVRQGARLDTARVTGEELTLTVTLAADADVRTFVDRLGATGASVQLTARRNRPEATRTHGGIRDSLETALTDRQLEALRTAYGSGFFEWPRETTGEGVAEMLGVAQPTVNRHLRVSQRKLLELVFEDE